MRRFFFVILSCFFSLVLQGQAFTHPMPAPDALKTDSIRKHLYCENTYQKYLVLAFYEEGETEPSLMLQAAKNKPERPIVTQADRTEGGITYSHAPSPSFNHTINTHFDGALTNNRRSFIDACWMKLYNGLGSERQHYYWLAPDNSNNPPRWNITDVATSGIYTNYYVREVSQRITP